jgi:hypothetical protein
MSEPDFGFWRQERARLLDIRFPTPDTGRCLGAVDTLLEIEAALVALRKENARLREALQQFDVFHLGKLRVEEPGG